MNKKLCEVCGSDFGEHAIDCPDRVILYQLDGHLEHRVYRLLKIDGDQVWLKLNKLSADPFCIDRGTFEKCYVECDQP
jgi:hypothetical protein